jgi:signal transduction histidine kinase/ligand-binding sensor domain-containing protein
MTRITSLLFLVFLILGCNQQTEIPLPAEVDEFPAPTSSAIKFGAETSIKWTDKPDRLGSVEAVFNYQRLPAVRFDTLGFEPLPTAPIQSPLNIDKLERHYMNYDSLPTIPLRFRTSYMGNGVMIPMSPPKVRSKKSDIIYEIGGPFNGSPVRKIYKARDGSTWIGARGKVYRYDGQTIWEYTVNGMSTNMRDMVEDKDGRLWIATSQNGVFVLDLRAGVSRQLSTSEGLPNNFCLSVIADHENRIWLTVLPTNYLWGEKDERGAVVIIDEANKHMKILQKSNGLSGNTPVGVLQDKAKNIWVATVNDGMNIIDLKGNSVRHLRRADGLLPDTSAIMIEDKLGRVCIAGINGNFSILDVHRSTLTTWRTQKENKRTFTVRLMQDKDSAYWLGSDAGATMLSSDLRYMKTLNKETGLTSSGNTHITEDSFGQILIGNEAGLNLMRRRGAAVRHVGNSQISTLMEDSHGRIWIGTLEKGIQIVDPKAGIAKLYNRTNGLSDDLIQYIVEYNGKVILSTQKGGIEIIDTSLKSIQRIGAAEGISAGNITAIETDLQDNIWLAGSGSGLDILDLKNKKVRHIGRSEGLKDSIIIDIKKDRKGKMWFYSYDNGVGIFDLQNKTIKHIVESDHESLTGVFEDNLLMHDSRGNTWLTSSEKGLFMIHPGGDSVTHFTSENGLLSNRLLYLKDHDGIIYVGTARGLNILTPPQLSSSGKWTVASHGNSSGVEKTVASYNSDLLLRNGDYWWGDDGITIIAKEDVQGRRTTLPPTFITGFDVFSKKQRFQPDAHKVAYKNDTIWMQNGGRDSFFIAGTVSAQSPATEGQRLIYDSLDGVYNLPVNLRLPYNQNYLQFRFLQRNLGATDTTWYRYIFDGIDKQWSAKTFETFSENYPNISPGRYTFRVSSLYQGRWGEPVSFSFTILPPWWQTWWAYLLYAVVAIALLRGYIIYRSARLRRENKMLEEKVTLRTTQLQKSLEDLKSTQSQLIQSEKMASLGELTAGIAHEIQNPLNFVNNFSEVNKELLVEMKDEIAKGNLHEVKLLADDIFENEEKINHHSKRAEAIVKGMLQHSRASSAVKEPADLNKIADEYFRLAYHGLRAKDKTFNATLKTDYDPEIRSVSIIPQDLGRVILNLITNAFYAVNEKMNATRAAGLNGYEPTVTVTTRKRGNSVEVMVADNGNGIPEKIITKIFQPFFTTKPAGQGTGLGLSMSYDIITQGHSGQLKAHSTVNEGTVFTISLPMQ